MDKKKKFKRDPIEVENSRKRALKIQEIREKLCKNDNSIFAAKIGVSKQYASGLCTASERITDKTLEKILKFFPEVSRAWLFSDEGEMLLCDCPSSAHRSEGTAKEERRQGEAADGQVAILRELLREKDREISNLSADIRERDIEISNLKEQISRYVTSKEVLSGTETTMEYTN